MKTDKSDKWWLEGEKKLREHVAKNGGDIYVRHFGKTVSFNELDADRQEFFIGYWLGSNHEPLLALTRTYGQA